MKFVVNNAHLTGKISGKENETKREKKKKKAKKMEGNSKQNHVYGVVDHIKKQWSKHAHSVNAVHIHKLFVSPILSMVSNYRVDARAYSVTSSFAAASTTAADQHIQYIRMTDK